MTYCYTKGLHEKGLIKPPSWLPDSICYEVVMGSHAYQTNTEDSDFDVYGFCLPPKDVLFPYITRVYGFDSVNNFESFQKHHVFDKTALNNNGREYDLTIFSIVKYFRLCANNNPNALDALFVPQQCVLYQSTIGNMVRLRRHIFLSKRCFHSYIGYAFSQLHKMDSKEPTGKRVEIRERYGFDVKFAAHVVRLLLQCQQIFEEGDIDLTKHSERIKAIKRGEVSKEEIKEFFEAKRKYLEGLYQTSDKVPYKVDEDRIRTLLLECLEHHYGNLSNVIERKDKYEMAFRDIVEVVERYK